MPLFKKSIKSQSTHERFDFRLVEEKEEKIFEKIEFGSQYFSSKEW